MSQVQDRFDDDFLDAPREVHLSEYWAVVRKRWRIVAVCVAAALVATAGKTILTTPLYRATVVINVEKDKGNPVDIGGQQYYDWYNPEFLPTQTRLMRSREIARRAAVSLNLSEDPDFVPKASGAARKAGAAVGPEAEESGPIAQAAARVQGGVSTAPIRGTNLVELSYVALKARTAADVANAVAEAYIDWTLEARFNMASQATKFLSAQVEQVKSEIDEKERELQAYGRQKDIVSIDPTQNVTLQKLESLNKDYAEAVGDRVTKEARYYEIQNAKPDAMAESLSGGLVTQLRNDLLKLEREYSEKLNVYKPEWPAMQQLRAQIQKGKEHLNTVIEETMTKAREQARADFQTAQRREESLKEVLRGQKVEAMTLNSNAVEYNNLRVEVSTKRALLDTLLKRQSETEMMSRLKGTRESSIRIVDRALPPGGRFSPSYRRNGMLGLLVGLAMGLGLAFFLEYLDRSIRSAEQVEQILKLPALGVIPAVGDATGKGYGYGRYAYGVRRKKPSGEQQKAEAPAIELLPHTQLRSVVAEAYRSFRTSLLLARAGGWKTLVVTSSLPGEGKTSTTVNLGVVLGQLGRRVLIVDADLHKPRVHEVLGLTNRVGLVSVLAEGMDLEKAIQKTNLPGVSVLTAGPTSPNPSGLLASEGMEQLFQVQKGVFDHVVIDSPPVQAVADALILGNKADGVVLCVKGGATAREAVVRARDRLSRAGARVLGVLINNLPAPAGGYGGYYPYKGGGGYEGYGYGDEPKAEADSPAAKVALKG
jgi:capsular exopolysaccharide synthesis family protein